MEFLPESIISWIDGLAHYSSFAIATIALLVLLVFYAVGYLLKRALLRVLPRAKANTNQWDETIIEALIPPARYGIRLMGIIIAIKMLSFIGGHESINLLLSYSGSIFLLLMGWFLWRTIRIAEEQFVERHIHQSPERQEDITTVSAIAKLMRLLVALLVLLLVLQNAGANISSLIAAGGVGGLAIGFAAKDLLANFFGGLLLYMERPFQVGDWIRVPANGIEGTVEDIGMRMTRLRTFDQRPLYVPNSLFTSAPVENATRMSNYKINITVGVRYDDAAQIVTIVDHIRKNLMDMEEIDKRRTLVVNFNEFAPSSLDIFIYCFAFTTVFAEYHAIKERVLVMIMKTIEAHDAVIAYPTSTLHLQQETAQS